MKSVLVGLDAFDPVVFEQLNSEGRLPNLAKFAAADQYRRFTVTDPPQSEVSWTSIATGLNPGGHGIFDFVHRNPANYQPFVSLLPTKQGLVGTQFVPPHAATTIFDQAVSDGFQATALWWPAMFPVRPQSPVRVIPGLGTPDLFGQWGVGTLLSTGDGLPTATGKSRYRPLVKVGARVYRGELPGPPRQKRGVAIDSVLSVDLVLNGANSAEITIGANSFSLKVGQWSDVLELSFPMGRLFKARAVTRAIVNVGDTIQLYFLPLQINPQRSPWHYATPPRFIKPLWKKWGPFLTVGWPQDTTGFEDGCMDATQFLALCDDIFTLRSAIFLEQLEQFEEGVLGCVFDSLDRIQHMFWATRPDIVMQWYEKFDRFIGLVTDVLQRNPVDQLLILSDHGFTDFHTKVHLNSWLKERGYLATRGDAEAGGLLDVDWSQTKAYALGLNSIYLNVAGREGQGIVKPEESRKLQQQLAADLNSWRVGDETVVARAQTNQEAFDGAYAHYGPDLVVGFATGYRASSETALGDWSAQTLSKNRDQWGADHCIDASAVPGVMFASRDASNYAQPSYRDVPALMLGKSLDGSSNAPPVSSAEDDEALRKRLESLGYL